MTTPKTPKRHRRKRGERTIKKAIMRNPRYKNMRKYADKIAYNFVNTTECPLCERRFDTPQGKHCYKDAIDHDHDLENSIKRCSYRGRLCINCNTAEGRAKARSKGERTQHIKFLGKMRKIEKLDRIRCFLSRVEDPSNPWFLG